jgi:DNA modification methylase
MARRATSRAAGAAGDQPAGAPPAAAISGPLEASPPLLAVEYRPVAELVPYARNARLHDSRQLAQIAASMRQFGWTNPVLIEPDGGIIAGHGRILAAEREWLAGRSIARVLDGQVPCLVIAGLSDAEKAALVLADNKIALNAGWDEDVLRAELQAIDQLGLDPVLTGFDGEELDALLRQAAPVLRDPDETPPVEEVAVSRLGDVWTLGDHRIACGDCTAAEVVRDLLQGDRPGLMVTDPPYGVSYDASWRNNVERPDGSKITARATGKVLNDDRADWRDAWALFPGAVAYVWHAGLFADVVAASLRAVRLMPRAQIVWIKQRHVLGRGDYHPQHEPALYAVREAADDGWRFDAEHETLAYHVREGVPGHYRGGRKQSTVWFIEHSRSETGHSTQKPVECMKRPIENNSGPGDLVYEPFSGSGTTLVAAEVTGRRCRAIELNPLYVDVAVRRWEQLTGRRAVLERQASGPVGRSAGFAEIAARRAKDAARGAAAS